VNRTVNRLSFNGVHRGCLDCGRCLPYQYFGVDWFHRLVFCLKPNYLSHAKILVTIPVSTPTRGQNQGGQIHRQFFGVPLFWRGSYGHKPNRPTQCTCYKPIKSSVQCGINYGLCTAVESVFFLVFLHSSWPKKISSSQEYITSLRLL
jgi:hypothetical protein